MTRKRPTSSVITLFQLQGDKVSESAAAETTSYRCASCDQSVAGRTVAEVTGPGGGALTLWMMCPSCGAPAIRDRDGMVSPSPLAGDPVRGLPEEIASAYREARVCASAGAFSACEMVCRKILMQVAVRHGAGEGESFTTYVRHLVSEGVLTTRMVAVADTIRLNANRASHEIPEVSKERAERTLRFCAQLLRLAFEIQVDVAEGSEP